MQSKAFDRSVSNAQKACCQSKGFLNFSNISKDSFEYCIFFWNHTEIQIIFSKLIFCCLYMIFWKFRKLTVEYLQVSSFFRPSIPFSESL